VLIGRNNRQNDQLTFRLAGTTTWFHAQEIPGSHVLLRLEGAVPDEADLQFAADLTAYYAPAKVTKCQLSTPNQSTSTSPKELNRELRIYKQERILWGQPQRGHEYLKQAKSFSRDFDCCIFIWKSYIKKHEVS